MSFRDKIAVMTSPPASSVPIPSIDTLESTESFEIVPQCSAHCQVCQMLLQIWESPWDRDKVFPLGSFLEMASMNCFMHQPLFTAFATEVFQMKPMGTPPSYEDIVCLRRFTIFSFMPSIRGLYLSRPFYLSNQNTQFGYKGIGRVVDPDWMTSTFYVHGG